MEVVRAVENTEISRSDGGRGVVNTVYILYIVGFFVGFTALVGVILAYVNRDAASEILKSHLSWQIKIFWRGVVVIIVNVLLYFLISAITITSVATTASGYSVLLYIIPAAIGVWWLVWTIMAIGKGMGALGRREAI